MHSLRVQVATAYFTCGEKQVQSSLRKYLIASWDAVVSHAVCDMSALADGMPNQLTGRAAAEPSACVPSFFLLPQPRRLATTAGC
jgi:hypothetical protein